jgi:hypothetical protein
LASLSPNSRRGGSRDASPGAASGAAADLLVAGSVRPELAAITVSRCHLMLVIRSPGELADLEHVQAEPLDLSERAV